MKKRLLSMLLVFVMLLGILPVGALAADPVDYAGQSFAFERTSGKKTYVQTVVSQDGAFKLQEKEKKNVKDSEYTFYLERVLLEDGTQSKINNGPTLYYQYRVYAKPDGQPKVYLTAQSLSDDDTRLSLTTKQDEALYFLIHEDDGVKLLCLAGSKKGVSSGYIGRVVEWKNGDGKTYLQLDEKGDRWERETDSYVLTLKPGQGGGSQSAVVRFYVKWHEPAEDEIAYDYYYNDVTEKDGTTPLNDGTDIQGKLKIASGYVLVGGDSPIYGQVIEGLSEGGEGASGAADTATWVAQCTGIAVPTISSAVAALNAAKSAHSLPINVGSEDGYSAITYESVAWSSSDKAYHVHMTLCPKTIQITYDGNGGKLSDGSTTTKYDDWTYDPVGYSVANNANGFSRTGYTFGGWYYKDESGALTGTNLQGTKIAPTANTTLFAKWELNTYNVTYTFKSGTDGATLPAAVTTLTPTTDNNAAYNSSVNEPTFTKSVEETDGSTVYVWTFQKWYTDAGMTAEATFPITVTDNVNLYGKWTRQEKDKVTITVNYVDEKNQSIKTAYTEKIYTGADYNVTSQVPASISYNGKNYAKISANKVLAGTNVTSDVTITVTYGLDEWKDADKTDNEEDEDSETDGDGIPDSHQALIKYEVAAEDTANGSVDPTVQVETLPLNSDGSTYATTGTVSVSSTASVKSGVTGVAFDYWQAPSTEDDVPGAKTYVAALNGSLDVEGGQSYIYTAYFATDVIGDENGGDGIPDKYQVTVNYEASSNGNIAATAKKTEVLTILVGGVYAETGTVTATGSVAEAAEGYFFSKWTEKVNTAEAIDTTLGPSTGTITIENVNGGDTITFTAYFAEKTYTVDVEKKLTSVDGKDVPADKMVDVGAEIVWTITVKNTGNQALESVTLEDSIPGVELYELATATAAETKLTQPFTLAVGAEKTIFAKYTVQEADKGKELKNSVTVKIGGNPGDTDVADNAVIVKNPAVSVVKTVDKTNAHVGDKLTYTVQITNTGNVDLTGIVPADMLSNDKSLSLTDKDGKAAETIDLNVEDSITLYATYTVTYQDVGETLVNTVTVKDGEQEIGKGSSEETTVKPNDPPYIPPTLNKENHVAYIIGYPDGTVRPENNITRAEVATIFFRLMTEDSREDYMAMIGENVSFTDVNEGAWYYNAIYTLAEAGILGGYPDGSFKPNAPITRAEFAAVVARFYEDVATGECKFTDVPKEHWAAGYIALAEGKSLINGYPDGTFRPEQPITRAETMTLINRVLERAVKEEDMLEDMVTWSDNLPSAWYYEAVQEATNSHEYIRTKEKVEENGIKQEYCFEDWTKIEEVPDWAALEKSWAKVTDQ